MAVTWRESMKGGWPVVMLSDPFTLIEWRQVLKNVCEQCTARRPLRLLIDGRYCSAPTADFVGRAVTALETQKEYGRVAVVVQSSDAYAMGRFAEAVVYIRNLPFEIQTFNAWEAAETWLKRRSPLMLVTNRAPTFHRPRHKFSF
jgi:hypothetical protein